MSIKAFAPWPRPTLGVQILVLLLSGLVVAQAVTVFLTLMLPPEPQPQYGLDDIAAALSSGAAAHAYPRPLQRVVQSGPPTVGGPGWLVSERSQHDLAVLLQKPDGDVLLYFFTPLPFAGTANPPTRESALSEERAPGFETGPAEGPKRRLRLAGYVLLAEAGGGPSGSGFPNGGFPGGGFPGAGFPGGGLPGAGFPGSGLPGNGLPGTAFPGGGNSGGNIPGYGSPDGFSSTARPGSGGRNRADATRQAPPAQRSNTEQGSGATATQHTGSSIDDPSSISEIQLAAPRVKSEALGEIGPGMSSRPSSQSSTGNGIGSQTRDAASLPSATSPGRLRGAMNPAASGNVLPAVPRNDVTAQPLAIAQPARPAGAAPATTTKAPNVAAAGQQTSAAVPLLPPPSGLSSAAAGKGAPIGGPAFFGLGPAPFIQGDFIAALKMGDGRWSVVKPAAEAFPNSWQKRVLLWFGVSFALVAPLGWMFAQRLAKPIAGFARAAEQLGRDPHAPVLALEGPAEVGRAAQAFNRMQIRLRSFVDDRTAMMGAISHDLRTPLTRLRFRLEDVPDGIREGMEQEVAEMEEMINSVLAFIRDASEPGVRERLDLRTIVEDVVEDAAFIGSDVALEQCEAASVEVDVLGMRRLLGNLVENAVKYGNRARVRLFRDHSDAVAEICDSGPGLPDDELERVFQPFYRAANARSSNKQGSGLGLAVCRSIARAHGGDVRLMRSPQGFIAQLRVPLTEFSG